MRIATTWLGGCSGCHMSVLDLDELLVDLAPRLALVYSPLVDIKEYPDQVDLVLIEGAVCNLEHVELARRIRARTKVVTAFGDCAVTGNVTAIRNQLGSANGEAVLQRAYVEAAQINASIPREPDIVPALLDRVLPLHEVIDVDCYLTSCPPAPARIRSFLEQVLAGQSPQLAAADLRFG